MENKFINIKQAAKILGVTTLTLRNWDNTGKFPAGRHPISNYRVYNILDIENLLEQMSTGLGRRKVSKKEVKKLMVQHIRD